MQTTFNSIFRSFLLALCLFAGTVQAASNVKVPILCYHNFHPSTPGSMTVSTKKFEQQLQWLQDNGFTVIPLQELVEYLQGKKSSIPDKAVVITADDGRDTVYKYMWPIVRKYNVPVTLFIYPSSISNPSAPYAMTWDQLRELQSTGQFDIQGHTLWHPNFKQEKKRLSESEYAKLVNNQLVTSKKILDKKLDIDVTLLAWPHGIYDKYLEQEAEKAGYVMAFSIAGQPANKSEPTMTQPRYMILESTSMQSFAAIANSGTRGSR
ncbi:MAG TPA: polysaccharide deacetylase family protein [Gammaproteobacteria bacterium]|nr:polysaccharide deacetylase family protein [Gammaproteobacteria bacterium]